MGVESPMCHRRFGTDCFPLLLLLPLLLLPRRRIPVFSQPAHAPRERERTQEEGRGHEGGAGGGREEEEEEEEE